MHSENDPIDHLLEPFALMENDDELRDLLTDLLTPNEVERLATRWQVMKPLAQGLRTSEVETLTDVSRTTISRASRVVEHGSGIIKTLVKRSEE